jgi:hypothetical protein
MIRNSMESAPGIKVHLVSIYRSEGSARPIVNTVRCRLCGVILERSEKPLLIDVAGWYAVSGEDTENFRVWKVDAPLPPGMHVCDGDACGLSS